MLMEDLLLRSGVEFQHLRGKSNEVMLPCPFCVGMSDQGGRRMVFGLNLENGKAHCHRCDWRSGGLLYTARELCKVWSIQFSWRMRLEASGADVEASHEAVPVAVPAGLPPEYEPFRGILDSIENKALFYLRRRGVTWEEIHAYQIGFAAAGRMAWRILFPVIGEDGVVYGCSGRDFSGQGDPKYLNTEGIKLLWNGQHDADVAIVVEGPMDAINVNRAIVKYFRRHVAMADLGSVATEQQIAQLAKYKTVIHFPDFDGEGVKGAVKRAEATAVAGIETKIIEPVEMNGSDPGDMDEDVIVQCIRMARPWSKVEKYRMRLAALR